MTASLAAVALALALGAPGEGRHRFWGLPPLEARPVVDPFAYQRHPGKVEQALKRIWPPGPGHGWGFPNGAPDGFGWYDPGDRLPLGFTADRTPEYFFRREFALPAQQLFFPTYYNTYVMRGQRYIPYTNCGGAHPAGGPPRGSSLTPMRPYDLSAGSDPVVPVPTFTGVQNAQPVEARPDQGSGDGVPLP